MSIPCRRLSSVASPGDAVTFVASGATLTNLGAGDADIQAVITHVLLNLSNASQYRASANIQTQGSAGAIADFDYSLDGTNWFAKAFCGVSTGITFTTAS